MNARPRLCGWALLVPVALGGCGAKSPPVSPEPSAEPEPAVTSRAEPRPPPAREAGRRTAGVTNDVVRYHRAKFRACYDRARAGDASLAGKVVLVFVIRPDGTVKSAEVDRAKSELKHDGLDACLVDTVTAIRFPQADEEVGSKMHYPFEFSPNGAR